MQQSRDYEYSYSIRYIMLYRHDHTNMVYNLIKPFTVDDKLFDRLTSTVIFVDTESNIPLTHLMQEEFSKIPGSPALIDTITGSIIIGDNMDNINMIANVMNDIYNECVMCVSLSWDIPFDNSVCERDDHYITEQMYNALGGFDTTNVMALQEYATNYQKANKEKEKINFPKQAVNMGTPNVTIKDKPDKSIKQSKTQLKLEL